jgi:hypothetical protein
MVNETGQVIGDLALPVQEEGELQAPGHEQDPVLISVDGSSARVRPLSHITSSYGQSSSKIITGAEYFSKGILTVAEKLGTSMSSSARNYTTTRPVTEKPLEFHPIARSGVSGLHDISTHAATVSSKTFGMIGNLAGDVGARISTAFSKPKPPGTPSTGFRGALKNSVMALNTLVDSVEASCVIFLSREHS